MSATRQEYKQLSEQEVGFVAAAKGHGEDFIGFLKTLPPSRENSLAITKIEEGVMWAVKAITA